jgi:hypothetical protein
MAWPGVTDGGRGRAWFLRAWRDGRAGPSRPAGVLRVLPCSVPVCGVLPRRASLRSINRVLPGAAGCAARVPTARNRARCTVRRDCPWSPASCVALRLCGLVPPPGGKSFRAAAGPARRGWATSRGRRDAHGGGPGGDDPGRDAGIPCLPPGDHGPQPAQQGRRARDPRLPVSKPVTVPAGQVRVLGGQDPVVAQRARPLTAGPAGRGGRSGSARSWWPRCARTGSARHA